MSYRLLSIAVVAGATRKGVGKALVESFEAEVGTTSTTYRLNVLKSNASAIRFYEKLAFRRVGETEIAWILRREVAANAALPGSPASDDLRSRPLAASPNQSQHL